MSCAVKFVITGSSSAIGSNSVRVPLVTVIVWLGESICCVPVRLRCMTDIARLMRVFFPSTLSHLLSGGGGMGSVTVRGSPEKGVQKLTC